MKKILLGIILVLFFAIQTAWGEVIFQDNFDSQADYSCGGGTPTGWYDTSGCASATYGGVTHYNWEIKSPGRGGSGKAFKIWKADSVFHTQTFSVMNYHFGANINDIYTRWYMKIPSSLSTTGAFYIKLWRHVFSPYVGDQNVVLNFNWSDFPSVAYQVGNSTTAWYTMLSVSEVGALADNQWHCWEQRVKLNTTGNSDGILQFWLDGTLKANITNARLGGVTGSAYTSTGIGIGNTNDATVWQSSWQAIELDDYVLSTSYGGPAADTTSPNRPQGLKIVQ